MKVLLSGIEMRFRDGHGALVEAVNTHTVATNAQTSRLEALCKEVKPMKEKMDVLCSRTARHRDMERDFATISDCVDVVENKTEVVSWFVSSLNERVEDIGVVIGHKADEIRKVEEERRLAELKGQEERRKVEATRLKEERERDERQRVEEAMRQEEERKGEERGKPWS